MQCNPDTLKYERKPKTMKKMIIDQNKEIGK